MDWQQKAAALNALAEISIKCRGPEDWYVDQAVEIKDRSILCGDYGNGGTLEGAITNHWRKLVEDIADTEKYLVVNAARPNRAAFRWNGFMWWQIQEPQA